MSKAKTTLLKVIYHEVLAAEYEADSLELGAEQKKICQGFYSYYGSAR
ncbi:MAG: hypothetical protein VB027_07280 [Gordonibacter sp.]|nr:hypothetical protein [Gordonibacter sp.]